MLVPDKVFHGAKKELQISDGWIWAATEKEEAAGYGNFLYCFELNLDDARIAIFPFHKLKLTGNRWLDHIAPMDDFDILLYKSVVDWSHAKNDTAVYDQILIKTSFIKSINRT